jgi:hypothetical protein
MLHVGPYDLSILPFLFLILGSLLGGAIAVALLFSGVAGDFYLTATVIVFACALGGFVSGVALKHHKLTGSRPEWIAKGIFAVLILAGLVAVAVPFAVEHPTIPAFYEVGVGLGVLVLVITGTRDGHRTAIVIGGWAALSAVAFAMTHSYLMLAITLFAALATFSAWRRGARS